MAAGASEVSSEAEETNRQAGHVHAGATGLATAVGELKHTVMRVVRTSTSEVDRRTSRRKEISLRCRLIISGQGVLNGRMVDLSEEGARVADAPRLSVGTRGMLDVDGVEAQLPFTVRNQYSDALGLLFNESAETKKAIRTVLDRLTQQAA
jgi:methyl-accepting chemotaxis protein